METVPFVLDYSQFLYQWYNFC